MSDTQMLYQYDPRFDNPKIKAYRVMKETAKRFVIMEVEHRGEKPFWAAREEYLNKSDFERKRFSKTEMGAVHVGLREAEVGIKNAKAAVARAEKTYERVRALRDDLSS